MSCLMKASEATQGRLSEKPGKAEKAKGGSCDKVKSDAGPKSNFGNIKYYGELKGYDFKSYGNIGDERSCNARHDKVTTGHEKAKPGQSFGVVKAEKNVCSDKYSDHHYHRSSHAKPPLPYANYEDAKYAPGTPPVFYTR